MRKLFVTLLAGAFAFLGAPNSAVAEDADTDTRGKMIGALYQNQPSFSLELAGVWDGLPAAENHYSCAGYAGGLHCAFDGESYAVNLNAPVELYGEYTFTGTPDAWVLSASLTGWYHEDEPFFRESGSYDLTCRGGRDPYELVSPDPDWPGVIGVCTLT